MTGVDVAAIRARLRAAVGQRWVRFYSAAQCADHIRTETTREWVAQFAATPHIAEFIAHAPTDIRALLDALAVAEQQRNDALAKIASVESLERDLTAALKPARHRALSIMWSRPARWWKR